MTSISHGTVALERIYPASIETVFAALSNETALIEWSSPGDGWMLRYERFDFRVGNTDVAHFGPVGGETYVNQATYFDILPNRRIVFSSTIAHQGRITFAGIVTMELEEAGQGTLLRLNETGAYLDDADGVEGHREGWVGMLDGLGIWLKRNRRAA